MRRILVAEDVELNQVIVKHIIQSWGWEVAIATNGSEAVKMISGNDYDLILMDIQMPEMDGIQATVQIRSLPDKQKAGIPIIAFTAHSLKEDAAKYIAAGMNDYLSKPFDEEKLYEIIMKYIGPERSGEPVLATDAKPVAGLPGREKLFDLSLIEAVSGGDKEFVRKMIDLFIETIPPNVQELNRYHAAQNWDMVSKMAHKLKSTLDSMGIQSVRQEVRVIEQSAKTGKDTDNLSILIHRVTQTVAACIKQLEAEMVNM